jgi:hypothetical protein
MTDTKQNISEGAAKSVLERKSAAHNDISQARRPKLQKKLKSRCVRKLEQVYAKCTSDICVRVGWSKNSEFLTTLKKNTYVRIAETKENRAHIYFGEKNGWCTIFLEKEQRFY